MIEGVISTLCGRYHLEYPVGNPLDNDPGWKMGWGIAPSSRVELHQKHGLAVLVPVDDGGGGADAEAPEPLSARSAAAKNAKAS